MSEEGDQGFRVNTTPALQCDRSWGGLATTSRLPLRRAGSPLTPVEDVYFDRFRDAFQRDAASLRHGQ